MVDQASIKQQAMSYDVPDGKGYLHRIFCREDGEPVLLVHGSLENGRIFYTERGKGLAPFLAEKGFDTYTMDWRGKGRSTPAIRRGHRYGQTEFIKEDLERVFEAIKAKRGQYPICVVGHSWGGVLLSSFLLRHPKFLGVVKGMVYFGTKRRISVKSWKRFVGIELVWRLLGNLLCTVFGYFNTKVIRLGVEGDTTRFFRQITFWVKNNPWVDPDDGFSYEAAANDLQLPPTLYLTGAGDQYLGNPIDVQRFIDESGLHEYEFHVCGLENGYQVDYGHVDLLTHTKAREEVYPMVSDWFRQYLGKS